MIGMPTDVLCRAGVAIAKRSIWLPLLVALEFESLSALEISDTAFDLFVDLFLYLDDSNQYVQRKKAFRHLQDLRRRVIERVCGQYCSPLIRHN
jgi:hypothetical protein